MRNPIKKKEEEKPQDEPAVPQLPEEPVAFREVEVNLSLLNDKLNYLAGDLSIQKELLLEIAKACQIDVSKYTK